MWAKLAHVLCVAPVRERGLKSLFGQSKRQLKLVAPVRERGLKYLVTPPINKQGGRSREGAWIEMNTRIKKLYKQAVAPVRERGLKSW